MKFVYALLLLSLTFGCIAGGKLRHKYTHSWPFRSGTNTWIFYRNQNFQMDSKSHDHVAQHDRRWGTWQITHDTLLIQYTFKQDLIAYEGSKQACAASDRDTLFVKNRKVYTEKTPYGYSGSLEKYFGARSTPSQTEK